MDKEKIIGIIAIAGLAILAKDNGADIIRDGNRASIIGNDRQLYTLGTQNHDLLAGRVEAGLNTRIGLIAHTNGEINLGSNSGFTSHNPRVLEIGLAFPDRNLNIASLGITLGIDGEDAKLNGLIYARLGGPSQP